MYIVLSYNSTCRYKVMLVSPLFLLSEVILKWYIWTIEMVYFEQYLVAPHLLEVVHHLSLDHASLFQGQGCSSAVPTTWKNSQEMAKRDKRLKYKIGNYFISLEPILTERTRTLKLTLLRNRERIRNKAPPSLKILRKWERKEIRHLPVLNCWGSEKEKKYGTSHSHIIRYL